MGSPMLFALLLPIVLDAAHASCGLDHCPIPPLERGRAVARIRATAAGSGGYSETFLGGEVRVGPTRLSALAPLLTVHDGDGAQVGLGNALANVAVDTPWPASIGLQAELPTSSAVVFGDRHVLLLPYAQAEWAGPVQVRGQLGWAFQVGGADHGDGHHHHGDHSHGDHHGDAGAGVPINPHTTSELLGRVTVRRAVWRVEPELGVDVIQELVDAQQTPLVGLASLGTAVERVLLRAQVQVPLTEARRNDLRGLFEANLTF